MKNKVNLIKLFTIYAIIVCFITPKNISAEKQRLNYYNAKNLYNNEKLIDIVEPYIIETFDSYLIKNRKELIFKIGLENFINLEKRLKIANQEKRNLLNKDAVSDVHVAVLRAAGADVEYHWWGKRVKTNSKDVAIKVRKLAHGFSGEIGDEGMLATLIATGIGFISGLGSAAAIVGLVNSVFVWADSKTWSEVSYKVAEKIDEGIYDLTIDINAWIMEVKVY